MDEFPNHQIRGMANSPEGHVLLISNNNPDNNAFIVKINPEKCKRSNIEILSDFVLESHFETYINGNPPYIMNDPLSELIANLGNFTYGQADVNYRNYIQILSGELSPYSVVGNLYLQAPRGGYPHQLLDVPLVYSEVGLQLTEQEWDEQTTGGCYLMFNAITTYPNYFFGFKIINRYTSQASSREDCHLIKNILKDIYKSNYNFPYDDIVSYPFLLEWGVNGNFSGQWFY